MDFPTLRGDIIAIDTETRDPHIKTRGPGWCYADGGEVIGISVACENFAGYFPIAHEGGGNMDKEQVVKWMNMQLSRGNQKKVFFNAAYDVGWLSTLGIDVAHQDIEDASIAAPLLDENLSRNMYNLDNLALLYTGIGKDEIKLKEWAKENKIRSNIKGHMYKTHSSVIAEYATQDAVATLALWNYQRPLIEADAGLANVYRMEMYLFPALMKMKREGVRVDLGKAETLHNKYTTEEAAILKEIKRLSGHEISITDKKTLLPIFNDLGVTLPKTATGKDKIDAELLTSVDNPVCKLILRAKKLYKVRSTYIEGMLNTYTYKGRIHCSLRQLASDEGGTITGRFSCSNPNLQNQPSPDRDAELGTDIRSLYLPELGDRWVSMDYKQQEPRLTLHYAALNNCNGAAEAVATYQQCPETSMHEYVMSLTGLKKQHAKDLGLGITYGMGEGKACKRLGLPTVPMTNGEFSWEAAGEEGKELLNTFHTGVPFLGEVAKIYKHLAATNGEFYTIMGRKCRFPYVKGSRWGCYKALNKLIQGSAGDQIKLAIIGMHNAGINIKLTVHDENCISTISKSEVATAKEIMESCLPLKVPSLVDIEEGYNWGECTPYK